MTVVRTVIVRAQETSITTRMGARLQRIQERHVAVALVVNIRRVRPGQTR